MKFLFTTGPVVDVIRRMGLDMTKINEHVFLEDILSGEDYLAHKWAVWDACFKLTRIKNPLHDTLANLENISLDWSAGDDKVCMTEPSYRNGGEFKRLQGKPNSLSSMYNYVLKDCMLLGDNTFLFVLDTVETNNAFYSIRETREFKKSMSNRLRVRFLKDYGKVYGVNSMLTLPLMSTIE